VFNRTLDLERVQSTDRSTQSCEGPKARQSPWPQAIKVRIHTEVNIMQGPIALDGVLDLKWPKYSLNLDVRAQRLDGVLDLKWSKYLFISKSSHKRDHCTRRSTRPQVTTALINILSNWYVTKILYLSSKLHEKCTVVHGQGPLHKNWKNPMQGCSKRPSSMNNSFSPSAISSFQSFGITSFSLTHTCSGAGACR
jgi:hypothetical protein